MKRKTKIKMVKWVLKTYAVFSIVYTGYAFIKARGVGKENDRHLIGKAIDRFGGLEIEPDEIITVDDTEMSISYNPYLQLLTNSLGSIAMVINGTTEVYTDNRFRNLSEATQKAILAHELGHYKLGHEPDITYQFKRISEILNDRVLQIELDADAYACKQVGAWQMIDALEELMMVDGISKKEIKLRINYIKSCIRYKIPECDKQLNVVGYGIYNGFHKKIGYENII